MKHLARGAALILMCLALASAYGIYRSAQFMSTPMNVAADGLAFEVKSGSSFSAVSRDLIAAELIDDDFWFRVNVRWRSLGGAIQAGHYRIDANTTPEALLLQFTEGDVHLYAFTLVEGWNFRDVLRALHRHEAISASMTEADWPALLEELGDGVLHPEGLFLPETYQFPRHTSDREVLSLAYVSMQEALNEEWQTRDPAAPVATPYDALILASIVEKETARADERARISGVFARRLQRNMRLQTDPTVIYGLGPTFNGNLTRRDLRTDTPYNTYTRHGLPPTPIAMPGRAAIHAALHPTDGDALYFVATGLADGGHRFSATKAEHDAAVAKYLQVLRQRRRTGG